MHTTHLAIAHGFRPGAHLGMPSMRRHERTVRRGGRTAWARFTNFAVRGRATAVVDGSGAEASAAPRRDLPLPFC